MIKMGMLNFINIAWHQELKWFLNNPVEEIKPNGINFRILRCTREREKDKPDWEELSTIQKNHLNHAYVLFRS